MDKRDKIIQILAEMPYDEFINAQYGPTADQILALDDWVSVEDRVPDMYQHVLILTLDYDLDQICNLAVWNGDKEGFLLNGGVKDEDVTHWQPLPEPKQ